MKSKKIQANKGIAHMIENLDSEDYEEMSPEKAELIKKFFTGIKEGKVMYVKASGVDYEQIERNGKDIRKIQEVNMSKYSQEEIEAIKAGLLSSEKEIQLEIPFEDCAPMSKEEKDKWLAWEKSINEDKKYPEDFLTEYYKCLESFEYFVENYANKK